MRPQDWPALLDDYVGAARRTPFVWGAHDCVAFVCGWHRLMTGRDVYAPFRGAYDSAAGAKRVLLDRGVRSMAGAGRYLFGEAKAPLRARRGDVALVEGMVGRACRGTALGICTGAGALLRRPDDLIFIPSGDFVLAWSV